MSVAHKSSYLNWLFFVGRPEHTWLGSSIKPYGKTNGDRGIYRLPAKDSKSKNGGKQEED